MNTPNEEFQYAQLTATSQVKNGSGLLGGIFVSSVTGSPTITIYDAASSGTTSPIVTAFVPTAGVPYPFPALFTNGLNVVVSGTCSFTVFYR